MPDTTTVLRQLADARLDGNLDGLVEGLRLGGWGWRRIAEEIQRRTEIRLSHETVRAWFPTDRPRLNGETERKAASA